MVWVYDTSGGNFVKRISNLTFMTQPEDAAMSQVYLGEFADDCTGEVYSKPNSGVLNYPTNVVLTGDEAKPVHLEGFARRVERAHQEARVLLRPRRDLDDAGHAE